MASAWISSISLLNESGKNRANGQSLLSTGPFYQSLRPLISASVMTHCATTSAGLALKVELTLQGYRGLKRGGSYMQALRKLLPLLPVFVLGFASLAPSGNLNVAQTSAGSAPLSPFLQCTNRDLGASLKGGRWEWQDVCDLGEVAISVSGNCPASGSIVGVVPETGPLNRRVYLYCTTNGYAHFSALCCR